MRRLGERKDVAVSSIPWAPSGPGAPTFTISPYISITRVQVRNTVCTLDQSRDISLRPAIPSARLVPLKIPAHYPHPRPFGALNRLTDGETGSCPPCTSDCSRRICLCNTYPHNEITSSNSPLATLTQICSKCATYTESDDATTSHRRHDGQPRCSGPAPSAYLNW